MDPNTGQVYESLDAATLAGVKNPVELVGGPEQIERISSAVAAKYAAERKAKRKAARRARRKGRS